MGVTKFVLKRPITMIMAVLCLIVFGLQSVFSSKLELMPSMEMPMLVIATVYPGANPEDVNDLVTTKIEDNIGSLSGVDTIRSYSMENMSMVLIMYDYDKDITEAYDDLKKKIDRMESDLPDDCQSPMVIEMNIDDMPVITLAVNNDTQENLYNYVNNRILPEFEKISSVSDVNLSGGQKQYVSVQLIPEKLQQYHLNMNSIASGIKSADFTYPAGNTIVGGQKLSVSAGMEYNTVDLLKKIPIALGNGNVICLEDIANVGLQDEDASGIARYNGTDTISLGMKKEQSAAAVDVSKTVRATADRLMKADPNLKISVVNDTSDTILSSLESVMQTMFMAVGVSMFIIWLFFGELKASLIVGTSIPISILAALVAMQAMGFTLNVVTLSALVLGVGMMVDNSIVVLESCFRSTKGKGLRGYREAALEGSGIVIMSIVGSTITTCVVFLPLALLSGMSGQMFKPLGFTIIFCMLASLISAMTIVPLCYCTYRPQERENSPVGPLITAMQRGYRDIMKVLLKRRKTVLLTSVGLLVLSIFLATQLTTELMANSTGGTIGITIQTRPGLTIEETDKVLEQAEQIVAADPDIDSYLLTYGGSGYSIGASDASLQAYINDKKKKQAKEIMDRWKPQMYAIPGANISMEETSSSSMGGMSSSSGLSVILQSTQYDELKEVSDLIAKELTERTEITKVHSSLENAAPIVKVDVDAVKANAENITPMQIAGAVANTIGGVDAGSIKVSGDEVDITAEYPKGMYDDIDELQGIVLTNNAGGSVALTDVADIYFKDSPTTISRQDKQYQVTISADYLTEDKREQKAIEETLKKEVVSKYLNDTVTQAQNSVDESMAEEFGKLGTAILTAVFLVFVVMAAQFESPKFSLMVMTTIPFALIGSFGLLWLADVSISMPTLLGFLMLTGTVVNNGILYVDTVNQYRAEMDLDTALIEAGATRLRPILMTTLTTIVAMIPMAFAYGDSGKSMQGLALVDVGGLIASTVLALLMLPIYYYVMTPKKKKEIHYD